MKINKTEILSFDEWYKEAKKLNNDGFSAKDFFEAGQQSRQSEVDNLKKRIDDLITSIDWHIEDCELWLSMNKNDSWKGGQLEILKGIKKMLKGGAND